MIGFTEAVAFEGFFATFLLIAAFDVRVATWTFTATFFFFTSLIFFKVDDFDFEGVFFIFSCESVELFFAARRYSTGDIARQLLPQ